MHSVRVFCNQLLAATKPSQLPPFYPAFCSGSRLLSTTSGQESAFELLIVDKRGAKKNVGYIQLNRPQHHNAISMQMSKELVRALDLFESDEEVRAVVYTGGEKLFTVGADITMMKSMGFGDMFRNDFSLLWNRLHSFRKPLIAAVNGFCVGGGTETVMMCDIIYAGDKAKFGQPEIKIGIIPGAGGTQRLTRAVGKSRSMEACLAGEVITAQQAESWGLISRVFPANQVIPEAIKLGELIATKPLVATLMAKEAVKAAHETGLKQGLVLEGTMSAALSATNDFKEGMNAFVEKREPTFTD